MNLLLFVLQSQGYYIIQILYINKIMQSFSLFNLSIHNLSCRFSDDGYWIWFFFFSFDSFNLQCVCLGFGEGMD